jgi:hypothetical protein
VFLIEVALLGFFLCQLVLVLILRGSRFGELARALVKFVVQGLNLGIEVGFQGIPGSLVRVHLTLELVDSIFVHAPLDGECVIEEAAIRDGPTLDVSEVVSLARRHWCLCLGRLDILPCSELKHGRGPSKHVRKRAIQQITRAFCKYPVKFLLQGGI